MAVRNPSQRVSSPRRLLWEAQDAQSTQNILNPTLRRQYHEMPPEGLYFNIHSDRKSWLRFSHPIDTLRTGLRLEQRSGRAQDLTIQYLSQHTEQIVDDQGQHWRRPISIQLDTGWDGSCFTVYPRHAPRISQPQEKEVEVLEDVIPLPERTASPDNVRELTLQLQRSQNASARSGFSKREPSCLPH